MTMMKRGMVVSALMVLATPSLAASTLTDLFLANTKANVEFLGQSGKLASGHSQSRPVREFAASEIASSVRTASLLDNVSPTTRLAAASNDDVVTGRSASAAATIGQAANGRSALSAADVSQLARLKGRAFDEALWAKQVDALSQLRADYEIYADKGDDAVLRSIAKSELPRVESRLFALSKI